MSTKIGKIIGSPSRRRVISTLLAGALGSAGIRKTLAANLICGGGPFHCANNGPSRECQIVCGPSPNCSEEFCRHIRDESSCDELPNKKRRKHCIKQIYKSCLEGCGLA